MVINENGLFGYQTMVYSKSRTRCDRFEAF